jgi:branched-subunit amino acid ABC-type transport system permease component
VNQLGDFAQYAIQGIPFGCVFALLAVGLTLNYKTSGVFNLAFAAQAYASAALFYVLRKQHSWPLVPAVVLAPLVLGTLMALVLDRAIYRHQRTAPTLAKLVTSLGLVVAIPQIVLLLIGNDTKPNPPPLWPAKRADDFLWPSSGRFVLDASQIATIVATLVVVLGLWLLFRRGSIGLQMRAVVESPRLVQLQGVDAERVALVSWILSSVIASLAGVLIAPLFAQLNSLDFFTLLVAAIAACVVGNLTSIPLAFLGGLGLGILQAELAGFLPTDSVLSTGLRPSLPFVVLFCLLFLRRSLRTRRAAADPMGGVDPPPPPPAATARPAWMRHGTHIFAGVVIAGGLGLCMWVLDDFWVGLVASGVCLAVVLLSITLTTGVGGTISLCQAAFAAIGAFATAQIVQSGVSVLVAMVLGGLVAAAVGLVLGAAIIRLPGIYAALATLAFALFFEGVLVPLDWVSGGPTPLPVPRPLVAGIDFGSDRAFLLLACGLLAILGLAVIAIRQGTTGRFLDAVRGSPTAARAIGINPFRQQLTVFVAGAGVAGFGGGLLACWFGDANYQQSFTFFLSLVWVVLVITAGSRLVQAAIISGVTFFLFPAVLDKIFAWPANYLAAHPDTSGVAQSVLSFFNPSWSLGVAFILFGFGALTYAKHPEGIIEAQGSAASARVVRLVDRLRSRGHDIGDDTEGGTAGARELGRSGNGSSAAATAGAGQGSPTAPAATSPTGPSAGVTA